MELDFEVVGDGYLATIRGDISSDEIRALWDVILDRRPEGGFWFGVLDIRSANTPEVRSWPADHAVLERLHPVARMINQTLRRGFRMAVVSTEPTIDAVITDLADLVSFGTPTRAGEAPVGRRFETVDAAMAWCGDASAGAEPN
ncbi:MAG: hypothetical protein AAGA90_17540 [Actinomycetota bacterium]